MNIGKAIKLQRVLMEMSRRQLASRASISYITLSNCENEKTNPSLKLLMRVSAALNIKLSELISLAERV